MGGCTKNREEEYLQYNKAMFNLNKPIGKGGFGKVWKATNKKTKIIYAIKVMDKAKIITKKSVKSIMNQKQILSKLNRNIFIVNMVGSFQDREKLYLVLDFLEGGDLRYYINRGYAFDQNKIRFVVRCIMEGLKFLHQKNIIHRDIKPENIILDKRGYCHLTDLGIARYWKIQNCQETSGTPGYMAPQVLLRQNHTFSADYFAVGVIAYQLAVGKRPFNGRTRKEIRDDMLAREAKIPLNVNSISKQGIDFINKLIQRGSKKRLGFNGIFQILQHPWMKMTKQQIYSFQNQLMKSPIQTLDITYQKSLQETTEPDQIWRQNILLLKKPETQQLFADYDCLPDERTTFLNQKSIANNFENSQICLYKLSNISQNTTRSFQS